MQIDGKDYGTSSVTKGLARHRMAQKGGGDEKKAAEPEMPKGEGAASEHDHGGQEGGHEVIQQVQQEHGPAQGVEVSKEGEHHSVTTHHEDGHTHKSKGHPSAQHVHEHLGHAVGSPPSEPPAEVEGAQGYGSLESMGLGGENES